MLGTRTAPTSFDSIQPFGYMESEESTDPKNSIRSNPIRSTSNFMDSSAPINSITENEEALSFSRSFGRRRKLAALWSPGILRHR